ncbi:MAG: hypothetical protein V1724_06495 [Chloroflexota bacterium]
MRLHLVQAFISKVFADDKFKERFVASADAAFSEFGLNKDERDAVLAAHSKLGWTASERLPEPKAVFAASWLAPQP